MLPLHTGLGRRVTVPCIVSDTNPVPAKCRRSTSVVVGKDSSDHGTSLSVNSLHCQEKHTANRAVNASSHLPSVCVLPHVQTSHGAVQYLQRLGC